MRSGARQSAVAQSQQIGGAIGVAVASSITLTHFNHELKTGLQFPQAFTSGAQWAFWVLVGVAAASFVATVTLIRRDELATAGEAVTVTA